MKVEKRTKLTNFNRKLDSDYFDSRFARESSRFELQKAFSTDANVSIKILLILSFQLLNFNSKVSNRNK